MNPKHTGNWVRNSSINSIKIDYCIKIIKVDWNQKTIKIDYGQKSIKTEFGQKLFEIDFGLKIGGGLPVRVLGSLSRNGSSIVPD